MIAAVHERQLAALAAQIVGNCDALTVAEKQLIPKDCPASPRELRELREAIRDGLDPLGGDFIRLRSPAIRRARGAIYTPSVIVDAMVEWAIAEPGPVPTRIVDAGSGSGRFILAAARAFSHARLIAVEIDPLAVLLLRANATAAGFSDRLTVHVGDYRTFQLGTIGGRTLFIGNPPYVRHHDIPTEAKAWFGETAKRFGFRASKLAGLHIHFFMRTRELSSPGDFGSFITSSEWIDVNYGSVLRQMLTDGLGGTALHVLHPTAQPFDGAMTTGAIACFRVGNRPDKFTVRAVTTLEELKPLSKGRELTWSAVSKVERWSHLLKPLKRKPSGVIEVGELFRVHRGQVTGCNAVWIAGLHASDVPARFLFPSITRAREIFAVRDALESTDHLRRIIDLPVDLDVLTSAEREKVGRFLKWARGQGAYESYIAQKRRAWWAVGLREPPPVLCTYMARRAPAFVRNTAGARYINIAHGLYPRQPMTDQELAAIITYLRQTVGLAAGRIYAGGLVKFEPSEVERLNIPDPQVLADYVTA